MSAKLTVARHHAVQTRAFLSERFTPKWPQTDITHEPMLKHETDIVDLQGNRE